MNFNFLIFFVLFALLSGCGVKSDPVPPTGTQLPSYVDKFLEDEKETKKKTDKEDEKKREP